MYQIVLLIAIATAQPVEPTISGPEGVTPIGKSVWIDIDGISVDELRSGSIRIYPSGYDVETRVMTDFFTGVPSIWFRANEGNALEQYDLVVTACVTVDKTSHAKVLEWSIKTGISPRPPPGPEVVDPPVVPPDAEGVVTVVVLAIPEELQDDDGAKILKIGDLVNSMDQDKVKKITLDPERVDVYEDVVDGDYPYVLILQDIYKESDKTETKKGAIVRWKGEIPDASTIKEEVEKWTD